MTLLTVEEVEVGDGVVYRLEFDSGPTLEVTAHGISTVGGDREIIWSDISGPLVEADKTMRA